MDAIRHIVAATDFSGYARHAAMRAARLAAQHGAMLALVHVVELDGLSAVRDWLDDDRDIRAAMTEQAGMELAAAAQQLAAQHVIAVTPELRKGSALQELDAAESTADLLVLGARGANAAREAALGTTADRLLRSARRPLLVVNTDAADSYRKVLALVDFSPASLAAFQLAQRLAPQAAFHLMHAFEVPHEGRLRLAGARDSEIARYREQARSAAQAQFDELLGGRGSQGIVTSIEQGDVRMRYREKLEALRPDLVVVAKQGRSFAADLFLGSVTRTVLADAPCDVLVVPPRAMDA